MKEEIEMLVSLALQVKLTPKQQKFIEQIRGADTATPKQMQWLRSLAVKTQVRNPADPNTWLSIWRSLVETLIDCGSFSYEEVREAAMKRRWPVDLVEAAWYALDLKVYEHNGERRFRLGDKVVPILPRRNEFPQQTANGGSAA